MRTTSSLVKKLSLLGASLSTLSLVALSLGASSTKAFGTTLCAAGGTAITTACELPNASNGSTFTLGTNQLSGTFITSPTGSVSDNWTGTIEVPSNNSLTPELTANATYISALIKNSGDLVTGSSLTLTNNGTMDITANQLSTESPYSAINLAAAAVNVTNNNTLSGTLGNKDNSYEDNALLNITAQTLNLTNNKTLTLTVGSKDYQNLYTTISITHMPGGRTSTLTNYGTISASGDTSESNTAIYFDGSGAAVNLTNNAHATIRASGHPNLTNVAILFHGSGLGLGSKTVTNAGSIIAESNADSTAIEFEGSGSSAITITNTGTISGSAASIFGATAILFNTDLNVVVVTNEGTISASGGASNTAIDFNGWGPSSIQITNTGKISATGGATNTAIILEVPSEIFHQPNTITLNKGSVTTGSVLGSGANLLQRYSTDILTINGGIKTNPTAIAGKYVEGFNTLTFAAPTSDTAYITYRAGVDNDKLTATTVTFNPRTQTVVNGAISTKSLTLENNAVVEMKSGSFFDLYSHGSAHINGTLIIDANAFTHQNAGQSGTYTFSGTSHIKYSASLVKSDIKIGTLTFPTGVTASLNDLAQGNIDIIIDNVDLSPENTLAGSYTLIDGSKTTVSLPSWLTSYKKEYTNYSVQFTTSNNDLLATITRLDNGAQCGVTIVGPCTLRTSSGLEMTITGDSNPNKQFITSPANGFPNSWEGTITVDENANLSLVLEGVNPPPYIAIDIKNDGVLVPNSNVTFFNKGKVNVTETQLNTYGGSSAIDITAETVNFTNSNTMTYTAANQNSSTAYSESLLNIVGKNITFINDTDATMSLIEAPNDNGGNFLLVRMTPSGTSTFTNNGRIDYADISLQFNGSGTLTINNNASGFINGQIYVDRPGSTIVNNHGRIIMEGNVAFLYIDFTSSGVLTFNNFGTVVGGVDASAMDQVSAHDIYLHAGSSIRGYLLGYGDGAAEDQAASEDTLTIYGGASSDAPTVIDTGYTPSNNHDLRYHEDRSVIGFKVLSILAPQDSQGQTYITYNATAAKATAASLTATAVNFGANTTTRFQGIIATQTLTIDQDAVVEIMPGSFFSIENKGTATVNGRLIIDPSAQSVAIDEYRNADTYTFNSTAQLTYNAVVDKSNIIIGTLTLAPHTLTLTDLKKANVSIASEGDVITDKSNALAQNYVLVDAKDADNVSFPDWLTTSYTEIKDYGNYTLFLKYSGKSILARIERNIATCNGNISVACRLPTHPTNSLSATITNDTNVNGQLIYSPAGDFMDGWTGTITVNESANLSPVITSTSSASYIVADITKDGTITSAPVSHSSLTFINNGTLNVTAENLDTTTGDEVVELAAETVNFTNNGTFIGSLEHHDSHDAISSLLGISGDQITLTNNKNATLSLSAPQPNAHPIVTVYVATQSGGSSTITNEGLISASNKNFPTIALSFAGQGSIAFSNSGTINSTNIAIRLAESSADSHHPNTVTLKQGSKTTGSIYGSGANTSVSVSQTTTDILDIEVGTTGGNTPVTLDNSYLEGFNALHIKETLNATDNKTLNYTMDVRRGNTTANSLTIDADLTLSLQGKLTIGTGTSYITGKLTTNPGSVLEFGGDITLVGSDAQLALNGSFTQGGNIAGDAQGHGILNVGTDLTLEHNINNLAALNVTSGTLTYNATVTQPQVTTNALTIDADSVINLQNGSSLVVGTGATTIHGVLNTQNGSVFNASQSAVTLAGSAVLNINNSTSVSIGSLSMDSGATLRGAGTLNISRQSTFGGTLSPSSVDGVHTLTLNLQRSLVALDSAQFLVMSGDSAATTPSLHLTGNSLNLKSMSKENFSFTLTPSIIKTLAAKSASTTLPLITTEEVDLLILPDAFEGDTIKKLLYSLTFKTPDNKKGLNAVFIAHGNGTLGAISGFSKNNKVLGRFFDQFTTSSKPGEVSEPPPSYYDLKNIYQSLVNTGSIAEAVGILNQLQPQVYGDLAQEVEEVSQRFATLMMNQTKTSLFDLNARWHVIASLVFNNTRRGSSDGQFGTQGWDAGVNITASKQIMKGLIVGGSLQYDHTTLEIDTVTQSAKSENINVGIFMGYKTKGLFPQRPKDHLYVQGSLAYSAGIGRVDRSTNIVNYAHNSIPFGEEVYSSTPLTNALRLTAQSEYRFKASQRLEVGPYVRLDVGWMGQTSQNEDAHQDAKLTPQIKSSSSIIANMTVGGALHWTPQIIARGYRKSIVQELNPIGVPAQLLKNMVADINLGWSGNLTSKNRNINYTLASGTSMLKITAHDAPGIAGAVWGVGLSSHLNNQTFAVRYDGSFAAPGTQVSNAVSLTLGMAF